MPTTKAQREKAAAKSSRYRAKLKAARAAPDFPVPDPPDDPAGALASWSASKLKVPSGPLRGEAFILAPWQIDFFRDALGPGILEAGCSLPRKCGKSGGISVLVAAYLKGPLHFPMWRGVCTSATGALAKELRDQVEQLSDISGLGLRTMRSPAPGHTLGANGSRLDFLAADKATGHAIGADLAIIEEGGLLKENHRDLWDAMISSVSGRDGRFLCMSIQSDGAMFAELRDRRGDKAVVWHEFRATEGCDIEDRAEWDRAHPANVLGRVKSYSYMEARSRGAAAVGNDSNFRAHDLNLSIDPSKSPIVTLTQWQHCVVSDRAALPPREGPAYLGIDLGGAVSLSAITASWSSGRVETWAACPSHPDLKARGKADGEGNLYVKAHERGELLLMGNRVTDPVSLIRHVAEELKGVKIRAAAGDQFRKSEFQDALQEAGVRWPMQFRRVGNGPDGCMDVESFRRSVISRKLRMVETLLMAMAIKNSHVHTDGNNTLLGKRKQTGRIDLLQSSIIALGLCERLSRKKPRQFASASISLEQMGA